MLEEVRRASETDNKAKGRGRSMQGLTDTDLSKTEACVFSVVCSPVSLLLGMRAFQKLLWVIYTN